MYGGFAVALAKASAAGSSTGLVVVVCMPAVTRWRGATVTPGCPGQMTRDLTRDPHGRARGVARLTLVDMTTTPSSDRQATDPPVAMRRGRRADRLRLAQLRLDRRWLTRATALSTPGA